MLLRQYINPIQGKQMKTLTMSIDDSTYQLIKLAAEAQKRNISNFIEYATLQYLTSSQYIDNNEMNEILNDEELIQNLKKGLDDIKNGDYTFLFA
jgi:uncharacterized protein (DUF1778 family)